MKVTYNAIYLGFQIGPNKGTTTWDAPLRKFTKRCNIWHDRPLGLHYHTHMYNLLAISTLSYIAQLENPPPEALATEQRNLHIMARGPGGICNTGWATPKAFGGCEKTMVRRFLSDH